MPNPTKSLQKLRESGTFQNNPGRYSARVEALEGFSPLGDPPSHLSATEALAWDEIRAKAMPGTLSEGDFMLVELAARLLAKSRHDWANFTASDGRVLQGLANDLAMTPLKRGRVSPAKNTPQEEGLSALDRILDGTDQPN